MGLFDEIVTDYREVMADIGLDVLWLGNTYRALVSENPTEATLEAAAIREAQKVTIKFLREDFEDILPKVGDGIQVGSERLRVSKLIDRPPHPLIIIEATR